MYVRTYACMHACMHLSIYLSIYLSIDQCIYLSFYLSTDVCRMYVSMYASQNLCIYLTIHVRICVYIFILVHVCVLVRVCIHMYICIYLRNVCPYQERVRCSAVIITFSSTLSLHCFDLTTSPNGGKSDLHIVGQPLPPVEPELHMHKIPFKKLHVPISPHSSCKGCSNNSNTSNLQSTVPFSKHSTGKTSDDGLIGPFFWGKSRRCRVTDRSLILCRLRLRSADRGVHRVVSSVGPSEGKLVCHDVGDAQNVPKC